MCSLEKITFNKYPVLLILLLYLEIEVDEPGEGVLVHRLDVGEVWDAEEQNGRVHHAIPVDRGWWTTWGSTGTSARCWRGLICRRTEWTSASRRACNRSSCHRSPAPSRLRPLAWRRSPPTASLKTTVLRWLSRPPICYPVRKHGKIIAYKHIVDCMMRMVNLHL